jgi:outer membrane protein assembly factor BamB
MIRRCTGTWLLFAAVATLGSTSAAADWPQFRGPDGQGHATAVGSPIHWSESENIRWKVPIAGLGWSSPVVSGQQVWLTTASETEGSLRAVCLDRETGDVLHDVEVFRKADLGRINNKNSHASPTPVIDGQFVFVHFGSEGTACLTSDGRIAWRAQLPYDQHHGPAGSPVVWRDLVFISCDGNDVQYTVALDKLTGEVRWKADHPGAHAYSTPLVIDMQSGPQLLTSGGGALIAYKPQTGEELWRCTHGGHSVIPRPSFANGLVYFCTGYWNPALFAVRPGEGDVPDSQVAFKLRRAVPHTPSPLVAGKQLYMVSDQGVLTCADAMKGKEFWHQRLSGNFSASPTLADGKLYIVSEEGTTFVVAAASDKLHLLSENPLDGRALASPAIVDRAIYLRTDTHLYRIEEAGAIQARATTSRRETGKFLR